MTLIQGKLSSLMKNDFMALPFNRQNVTYWSVSNPHLFNDSETGRGEGYGMGWNRWLIGLPTFWFSKGLSNNADNYSELVKNVMWPSLEEKTSSENYYYQQVRALTHYARQCFHFWTECFPERVMSRRTDFP